MRKAKVPNLEQICKLSWMRVYKGQNVFCFAVSKDNIIVATDESRKRYLGRDAHDVAVAFHRLGAFIERDDPSPKIVLGK